VRSHTKKTGGHSDLETQGEAVAVVLGYLSIEEISLVAGNTLIGKLRKMELSKIAGLIEFI
jgi:hypothetical protein